MQPVPCGLCTFDTVLNQFPIWEAGAHGVRNGDMSHTVRCQDWQSQCSFVALAFDRLDTLPSEASAPLLKYEYIFENGYAR